MTREALAELDAEERAFLCAPWNAASDGFAACLTRTLAATLSARLRLPVTLAADEGGAGDLAPDAPVWHIDPALAGLWLTRRLGGRMEQRGAPFVPAGLRAALDAVLAERWLDGSGEPPASLAWRLRTAGCEAPLALAMPHDAGAMTRWAWETIRG